MSWLLLVREEAERDLEAARDWYEHQRPGLGDEFLDEFAAAMRGLEANPKREHLYYRSFRRVLFQRFPYKIFYQLIGERVVVFRVLHAKQAHEQRIEEGLNRIRLGMPLPTSSSRHDWRPETATFSDDQSRFV